MIPPTLPGMPKRARLKQPALAGFTAPMRTDPTVQHRDGVFVIHIPGVRLVNATNEHTHWRVRSKRAKAQRGLASMVLRSICATPPPPPLTITITRHAPSNGLDSDSLPPSGKHLRDGIADFLGVDDGSASLTWLYCQERGPWGVTIQIEARAA
ncbi:MAG: hypothetical protein WC563_15270 [Brevundimonas sp.]